jgi:hypothetical protein
VPGGQPADHKADPKRSKAKPWRASLARSGARFVLEDGLTAQSRRVQPLPAHTRRLPPLGLGLAVTLPPAWPQRQRQPQAADFLVRLMLIGGS